MLFVPVLRQHKRVSSQPSLSNKIRNSYLIVRINILSELLEHARLHGEELAAEHQRSMDTESVTAKRKYQRILPGKQRISIYRMILQ